MIPRFQQVDHAVQAKNSVFRSAPLHWHTHYEIELTMTGSVRHIVNGQVYMTSPGFVSIMTPCDFHQYVDSGCESRIKKLFFEENYLSPEILQLMLTMQVSRCIQLNPQDFADVTAMFDELIATCGDQTPIGRLRVRNLTERLCLTIMDACFRSEETAHTRLPERDKTSLLSSVLTYISEHFTEKITLEEAGAVVHLNANYLSHLFSRSLGMTFSQYVKCKRISYASVLLLTTDAAIDEVAYSAGFSSTSFFNHVFKEQYRMSPFAYRSRFGVARNRKGESEDPPKL